MNCFIISYIYMKIFVIRVTEIEDCATINYFYDIKVTVKLPSFVSMQNHIHMTGILGECTKNYRAHLKKNMYVHF